MSLQPPVTGRKVELPELKSWEDLRKMVAIMNYAQRQYPDHQSKQEEYAVRLYKKAQFDFDQEGYLTIPQSRGFIEIDAKGNFTDGGYGGV